MKLYKVIKIEKPMDYDRWDDPAARRMGVTLQSEDGTEEFREISESQLIRSGIEVWKTVVYCSDREFRVTENGR